jgi:PhnB protein
MHGEQPPEYQFRSPKTIGSTPINLLIYVSDVNAITDQAVAAGARVIRPVEMQFTAT